MDMNMLATIICLTIGVILLIVEMFIPGFGITGILGAIALFAAVLLQIGNPLGIAFMAAIVLFLLAVATIVFAYLASKGKFNKNRLVLNEQIDGASTNIKDEETGAREGLSGVSKTPLRPAGKAEFDGVIVDVCTAGEFLPSGANIIIKKVEGLRVLVQEISLEQ